MKLHIISAEQCSYMLFQLKRGLHVSSAEEYSRMLFRTKNETTCYFSWRLRLHAISAEIGATCVCRTSPWQLFIFRYLLTKNFIFFQLYYSFNYCSVLFINALPLFFMHICYTKIYISNISLPLNCYANCRYHSLSQNVLEKKMQKKK